MDNTTGQIKHRFTAENIFVSIGDREILKGVTISAQTGQITGLLGRNGSGKSTMLKSAFGTQKVYDKTIQVNGETLRLPYAKAGAVNYLPQHACFPDGMKPAKAIANYGIGKDAILNEFPELADEIGKSFNELSGGNERLLSALILILADTKFTMLDEPFTHIMPMYIERLKAILIREKMRKGIILTDHMYESLLEVSDVIYLMKDGKTSIIQQRSDLVLHGYLNDWQ
jgi:ABC-type multidrug transport system ATPase subunit